MNIVWYLPGTVLLTGKILFLAYILTLVGAEVHPPDQTSSARYPFYLSTFSLWIQITQKILLCIITFKNITPSEFVYIL
jgi:hypothetical protein